MKTVVQHGGIPRPIRWLAALGLLPVPGPFDEAVLLVVALILFVFYRSQLREAWALSGPGGRPASQPPKPQPVAPSQRIEDPLDRSAEGPIPTATLGQLSSASRWPTMPKNPRPPGDRSSVGDD